MDSRKEASGPVPNPWPQPALLILSGPPGTGKSHLARILAERLPARVVSSDQIRLGLSPQPTYTPQEHARVFFAAHRQIDRLLRRGEHVLFDATNVHERDRRAARRIGEQAGARVLVLLTVAPEETVAERLQGRRAGLNPADRSQAGWEIYARMRDEFEPVRGPYLEVDTSLDLEPAVQAILRFVKG